MCEAGEESCCVVRVDGFHERVPSKFDGFEEEQPSCPGSSPLLFRFFCNGCLAGIFAIHTERNDTMAGGSGAIEKDGGSWDGTEEVRRVVSWVLSR